MDPEYRYYAISLKGEELGIGPTRVCRRWVDENGHAHDEVYVNESAWTPTSELAEAESGDGTTEAHPLTETVALGWIDVQLGRKISYDPVDGKYNYFALLHDDHDSVDKAREVIREWTTPQGYNHEERYTPDAGWTRSYLRDDINRSHKSLWLKPITEEDVERYKELEAERRSR